MNFSPRQFLISLLALAIALIDVLFVISDSADFGTRPLLVRAILVDVAILASLITLYPLFRFLQMHLTGFVLAVCLPALLPAFLFYLLLLPRQAGEGIEFTQLQNSLISDSSSNGIVEIGFAYPIYTPTVQFQNRELFTRRVTIFLRMVDASGEEALFRGVRAIVPGSGLSVEATVQGMLARNDGYLFNPLTLPPRKALTGRVVFVISNAESGALFTEALRDAQSVQLELRDPQTGELFHELPLNRD